MVDTRFLLLLGVCLVPTVSSTTYAFDYVNVMSYDYILEDLGSSYWGDLEFESTSGNTEEFWAAVITSEQSPASLLKDKSRSTTMSNTHVKSSDSYTANQEIELNDVASFFISKSTSTPRVYEHIVYLEDSNEEKFRITSLETTSSSATLHVENSCATYLEGDSGDVAYFYEESASTSNCLVAIHGDDGIIYLIDMDSGDVLTYDGNDCSSSLTSCSLDWKGYDEADVKFSMIPLGEVGYYEFDDVEAYFVVSNLEEDLLLMSNEVDEDIVFSTDTKVYLKTTETSTGIYNHIFGISYYEDGDSDMSFLYVDTLEDSTSEEAELILTSSCEFKIIDGDGNYLTIYEATDGSTNCVVGFYEELEIKVFDYYDATEDFSYNDQCDSEDGEIPAYCDLTYECDEDEVENSSYMSVSSSLIQEGLNTKFFGKATKASELQVVL